MTEDPKPQLAKNSHSQQSSAAKCAPPSAPELPESAAKCAPPSAPELPESAAKCAPPSAPELPGSAASSRSEARRAFPAEIVFVAPPRVDGFFLRFSLRELTRESASRAAAELAFLRPQRARRNFWNLPAKRAARTRNPRRDASDFRRRRDRQTVNDDWNDLPENDA